MVFLYNYIIENNLLCEVDEMMKDVTLNNIIIEEINEQWSKYEYDGEKSLYENTINFLEKIYTNIEKNITTNYDVAKMLLIIKLIKIYTKKMKN